MSDYLTKKDWDRIQKFVETPSYKRTPEILVPKNVDDDGEE
ncbi:hypothetical protein [Haloarchaeobius sp. DFWS5]